MRRNYHPTLLAVFDQPVLTTNCLRRDSSAVVLQSLAMLNDDFLVEESGALAAKVMDQEGPSSVERIETAFRLVLNRRPTDDELGWCLETLDRDRGQLESTLPDLSVREAAQQALARLCQTLFNTSEFLYLR